MKDVRFYGQGLPYRKLGNLKGHLIAIEGTDNVGRSTQIERLIPWLELQGHGVTSTRWTRSALLFDTINQAKAGHRLNMSTFALLYATDFADRLENEIIPALEAGRVVLADRYMYTAFARSKAMGADPAWSRALFGFALIPDLVLYLKIDVETLIPRALEGKGINYWESGMHLGYGKDLFESFRNYQRRMIREFNAMAQEFGFVTVDARRRPELIQTQLRRHIGGLLNVAADSPAAAGANGTALAGNPDLPASVK